MTDFWRCACGYVNVDSTRCAVCGASITTAVAIAGSEEDLDDGWTEDAPVGWGEGHTEADAAPIPANDWQEPTGWAPDLEGVARASDAPADEGDADPLADLDQPDDPDGWYEPVSPPCRGRRRAVRAGRGRRARRVRTARDDAPAGGRDAPRRDRVPRGRRGPVVRRLARSGARGRGLPRAAAASSSVDKPAQLPAATSDRPAIDGRRATAASAAAARGRAAWTSTGEAGEDAPLFASLDETEATDEPVVVGGYDDVEEYESPVP